jgi:peptide/nickel transport system permease protein
MSGSGARALRFAGLVAAVLILNFAIPRLMPGSPLAGGGGEHSVVMPSASYDALARAYRLNEPLSQQFTQYLTALTRGDLGWSLRFHRPVNALLVERLPWTLLLVGGAVMVATLGGGALGIAAAWRGQRRVVRAATGTVIALAALPEFVIAMALVAAFTIGLRWFPASGGTTLWHATLPGIALTLSLAPVFVLVARNAVTPILAEGFLVTARAKGLPERRVVWHAVRNALPPIVSLTGIRLGAAIAGAAVIERIFAYPGLGSLTFEAIGTRDFPLMQGIFLVTSLSQLTINAAADALVRRLDPRSNGP